MGEAITRRTFFLFGLLSLHSSDIVLSLNEITAIHKTWQINADNVNQIKLSAKDQKCEQKEYMKKKNQSKNKEKNKNKKPKNKGKKKKKSRNKKRNRKKNDIRNQPKTVKLKYSRDIPRIDQITDCFWRREKDKIKKRQMSWMNKVPINQKGEIIFGYFILYGDGNNKNLLNLCWMPSIFMIVINKHLISNLEYSNPNYFTCSNRPMQGNASRERQYMCGRCLTMLIDEVKIPLIDCNSFLQYMAYSAMYERTKSESRKEAFAKRIAETKPEKQTFFENITREFMESFCDSDEPTSNMSHNLCKSDEPISNNPHNTRRSSKTAAAMNESKQYFHDTAFLEHLEKIVGEKNVNPQHIASKKECMKY